MELRNMDWCAFATQTDGPGFARFQRELTRTTGAAGAVAARSELARGVAKRRRMAEAEGDFVEAMRKEIAPCGGYPARCGSFIAWFERLRDNGPGQGDPLFPGWRHQPALSR